MRLKLNAFLSPSLRVSLNPIGGPLSRARSNCPAGVLLGTAMRLSGLTRLLLYAGEMSVRRSVQYSTVHGVVCRSCDKSAHLSTAYSTVHSLCRTRAQDFTFREGSSSTHRSSGLGVPLSSLESSIPLTNSDSYRFLNSDSSTRRFPWPIFPLFPVPYRIATALLQSRGRGRGTKKEHDACVTARCS